MTLAAIETVSYIGAWKLIPAVLCLLVWARVMTWIDKDSKVAHLPRVPVNLTLMGVGILAFGLFFFLPNFWASFAALVVLLAGDIGGYLAVRSKQIGLKDISGQLREFFQGFGKKKGEVEDVGIANEVQVFGRSGKVWDRPAKEDALREIYDSVQTLINPALKKGADSIQMQLTHGDRGELRTSFSVDGASYPGAGMSHDAAVLAVEQLKMLVGLEPTEKRKPQSGKLKFRFNSKTVDVNLATAGNSAGETLNFMIDPKGRHKLRMEELGLSDLQQQFLRDLTKEKEGIVLLAAPKTHGLTTLCYAVLRAHDAFLNHIQTIERAPDTDLEGITQNKLPAGASPAEEFKQVQWVCSQEPDVIMMTSLEEPQSAVELARFAATGRRVYVAVRAGSSREALNLWRKWIGDDQKALQHLATVVSGRVVRKLCDACKVGYEPDEATLKKMNFDPAKVQVLYQERTEPMLDQKGNPVPCDFCQDLHFKGRTGVYEVLIVDDEVKSALAAGASETQFVQLFRKQRMPFLQESAFDLIRQGHTSVKEVQRAFKGAADGPPPAAAPAASRPRSSK